MLKNNLYFLRRNGDVLVWTCPGNFWYNDSPQCCSNQFCREKEGKFLTSWPWPDGHYFATTPIRIPAKNNGHKTKQTSVVSSYFLPRALYIYISLSLSFLQLERVFRVLILKSWCLLHVLCHHLLGQSLLTRPLAGSLLRQDSIETVSFLKHCSSGKLADILSEINILSLIAFIFSWRLLIGICLKEANVK